MGIVGYQSSGGKNVIKTFVDKMPELQRTEILEISQEISEHSLDAFEKLNTRLLQSKLCGLISRGIE